MPKVKRPTKDHLHLGGAHFCLELVPCVHAFAGDGFFGMIWPSGRVDGKEGSRLSTGNIVGTWDVDLEADDVVNVDVVNSAGVNRYINNQLSTFGKRGVVIEKFMFRD